MIPRVIADLESHLIQRADLLRGEQMVRMLFAPLVVETADEKGRSETKTLQQGRNGGVLTRYGVVESENDCFPHKNSFLQI